MATKHEFLVIESVFDVDQDKAVQNVERLDEVDALAAIKHGTVLQDDDPDDAVIAPWLASAEPGETLEVNDKLIVVCIARNSRYQKLSVTREKREVVEVKAALETVDLDDREQVKEPKRLKKAKGSKKRKK